MLTILILGSKPGATIPGFDIAYCANSSGALYADYLEGKTGVLNSVIAASELMTSPTRVSEAKLKWQSERIDAIHNLKNHHIKLVSAEFFPSVLTHIDAFDEHKSLEVIPHSKYENLLSASLGVCFPVITKEHLSTGASTLKEMSRYALEYLRYNLSSQYLVNPLYRQSTGLTCLLEAISCYGKAARYRIEGVGFTNRNKYEGGAINTWTPAAKMARSHVLADRFIFEKLRQEYEIEFVEN